MKFTFTIIFSILILAFLTGCGTTDSEEQTASVEYEIRDLVLYDQTGNELGEFLESAPGEITVEPTIVGENLKLIIDINGNIGSVVVNKGSAMNGSPYQYELIAYGNRSYRFIIEIYSERDAGGELLETIEIEFDLLIKTEESSSSVRGAVSSNDVQSSEVQSSEAMSSSVELSSAEMSSSVDVGISSSDTVAQSSSEELSSSELSSAEESSSSVELSSSESSSSEELSSSVEESSSSDVIVSSSEESSSSEEPSSSSEEPLSSSESSSSEISSSSEESSSSDVIVSSSEESSSSEEPSSSSEEPSSSSESSSSSWPNAPRKLVFFNSTYGVAKDLRLMNGDELLNIGDSLLTVVQDSVTTGGAMFFLGYGDDWETTEDYSEVNYLRLRAHNTKNLTVTIYTGGVSEPDGSCDLDEEPDCSYMRFVIPSNDEMTETVVALADKFPSNDEFDMGKFRTLVLWTEANSDTQYEFIEFAE